MISSKSTNTEHTVNKCRKFDVKNIFFTVLYSYCDYLDYTNNTEVVEMVCTFQVKANIFWQTIMLKRFVKFKRSSWATMDEHTQGNSHVIWKTIFAEWFSNTEIYLHILKDTIFNSPKIHTVVYLNLNPLMPGVY